MYHKKGTTVSNCCNSTINIQCVTMATPSFLFGLCFWQRTLPVSWYRFSVLYIFRVIFFVPFMVFLASLSFVSIATPDVLPHFCLRQREENKSATGWRFFGVWEPKCGCFSVTSALPAFSCCVEAEFPFSFSFEGSSSSGGGHFSSSDYTTSRRLREASHTCVSAASSLAAASTSDT